MMPNCKASVLIVDDTEEWRSLIATTLTERLGPGVEVHQAENGVDALLKLQECRVDVVITDTNMPQMNGIELLKAVREHFPTLTVYVLFDGLLGSDLSPQQVREMGADLVTRKMDLTDQLLPRLRADLRGRWLYRWMRSIFA